jgi:hypothetical protein
MAQQTAMKKMIDYLEEMKSKTTDQSEIYMLIDAWVHAVHLMQVEKAQRIKDYNAGYDDAQVNHINDAENYINEQEYLNSK